ncbi:hypothetical protein FK498_00595 [Elioraea sp. Yellowstone]|jgi:hypothetical protein|uniref:hypothetical protein n=1 Tax=Elioraea sp. Yellowstone TaxID=2592070 RepID=UPI0011525D62|nr:hypothetical protein [Elioraea sp. Yellowstone]TQF85221.1 hypothetical protein FK498_00595 [Elioraea sp. Yellowstone]
MTGRGGGHAGEVRHGWLPALRLYVVVLAPLMLVWETAQMPLYTLWQTGTVGEITYAIVHCTLGDALIGLAALTWALVLVGSPEWPRARFRSVATATLAIGLGYLVYSEWVNIELRGSWAYTDAMPRLPPFRTGLAPLLQWLAVPPIALWAARRACFRRDRVAETVR